MNDEIEKLLKPQVWCESGYRNMVTHKDFEAVVRGFLKMKVQRNYFASAVECLMPFDEAVGPFDAEVLAAMKEGAE